MGKSAVVNVAEVKTCALAENNIPVQASTIYLSNLQGKPIHQSAL
jgi:hypothetical protein